MCIICQSKHPGHGDVLKIWNFRRKYSWTSLMSINAASHTTIYLEIYWIKIRGEFKLYKISTKIEDFVRVVNCFNPSAIFTKIFQLRQNCPCLELFWFAFSWIWTKYEEIICISPLSFQMRENMDQNNSKYGHVLRSGCLTGFWIRLTK